MMVKFMFPTVKHSSGGTPLAALKEYMPICLGSLFAPYMLQAIEPAKFLLEFTELVNRVIVRKQEREWEEKRVLIGKNNEYRGSFISCVST